MSTFGKDLIESLNEALDHASGRKTGAREHRIEVPDVRALREALNMSQPNLPAPIASRFQPSRAGNRADASRTPRRRRS